MRLYTIGHSNHLLTDFLNLLLKYGIDCIVDVRSIPASKYSPQFNKETLQGFLRSYNMDYQFFGYELGARRNDSFNELGYVDFELTVQTALFQEGVHKLTPLLEKKNIALMCSEADPLECHRFSLVGRYYHEEGLDVNHILKDATISSHEALEQEIIVLFCGWKNGHMVTAVTVTAIQTLQNRGFVYKYIYLTVVLMPCTSDGEALYDSKECLL